MTQDIRVWVDGHLVDAGTAALSALDHGVTVGDGVFETLKVVDGQPFALRRHHRRLGRSMGGLGLPPADLDHIGEGINAVLAGPPIAFGRLRYTITGGVGPLGSDRLDSPLTYIVTAGHQPPPPASCAVHVVPWTRNERAATAGLKTTSYAENVVALAYAQRHRALEAVFANTRGELCEGTGSNIFVVVDGVLRTPPADSGLLLGITRELVIEWCREAGLEVVESTLPVGVLDVADEVFITSSTKDVFPVHSVGGLAVPDRQVPTGPVTGRAQAIFAERAAQGMDP